MHGIGTGDLAGREQRGDVEIAVLGRRRSDANALVRQAHMHGIGVGGGVHGDGRDAELLAGPEDKKGDLTAIGYEDLVEHGASGRKGNSEWRIGRSNYSLLAIRHSLTQ